MERGLSERLRRFWFAGLALALVLVRWSIQGPGTVLARNLTYLFLYRSIIGMADQQLETQAEAAGWLLKMEGGDARYGAEVLFKLGQGDLQDATQILAQDDFISSPRFKLVLLVWGAHLQSRIDILRAVQIIGPERGVTLLAPLAELYQCQRNYTQARLIWEEIIELIPNNVEAHHNLAQVLTMGFEDYATAVAHYQEVIRLKPDATAEDNYLLGHCLYMAGRYEEAAAALKQARSLSPTDERILIDIAQSEMKLGRLPPQEILAIAQEALGLNPSNHYTYSLISSIYWNLMHDATKAEAAAQEALALNPTNSWVLVLMADIRRSQARFEEASSYLDRYLQLRPDTAGIWVEKGDILLQGGQTPEACQSYLQALQVQPDDSETLQKLNQWCPTP